MKFLLTLVSLPALAQTPADGFTGSAKCETCHPKVYARWKKTLMANVLQDPKARPEAILGDFTKPNALVTFKKAQGKKTATKARRGKSWKEDRR